jgi:hypothetical protein
MRFLARLLTYTAVVCALAGGMVGGTLWLLQPDATMTREARAAPIPPRIADSIERRKPTPVPVAAPAPEPAKPVMQTAPASLTHQPTFRIRDLSPPPPPKRNKRRERAPVVAQAPPVSLPQAVTTARTDFPY